MSTLWSQVRPKLPAASGLDLAEFTERPRSSLARWMDGSVVPSIDDAEAIMGAFGITLVAEIRLPDPRLRVMCGSSWGLQWPTHILQRVGPRGAENIRQAWPQQRTTIVRLLKEWKLEGYTLVNLAITNRMGSKLEHDYRIDELLDVETCPLRSLRDEVRIVVDL